jgi:multicomponent Na+:H+ antiporter subunit C
MMTFQIPYIAVAGLIILGLYAVLFKRNLIKIIIGITLIQSGVNLFLITISFREGSVAPIYTADTAKDTLMSLPVPQALTLTSIVIGVAVLALMLSLVIHIYRHYKTLDVRKIREEGD